MSMEVTAGSNILKNQATVVLSWAKFVFPQAAFHATAGCFHTKDISESRLQHFTWTSSLWNQHHFPTTAISDMGHWWVLHTPTTLPATASCTLQFWTPAASLPLLWETRGDRERGSFLHLTQPTSPGLTCAKGFLLHWGDLLVQGWGGSLCSGWDKHPEAKKLHLWHSQCCCPQGVPGPPRLCHPQGPEASRSLTASG